VSVCEAAGGVDEPRVTICRERSFYVGDAAGRPGDHSDSDRKMAQAAGLPFFTETEFFNPGRPPLLPGGGGVASTPPLRLWEGS
jgi:hypothetical protein